MAQLTWEYIAGFFDGEGHIVSRWPSSQLSIAQSGPEGHSVLSAIQDFFFGVGVPAKIIPQKSKYPGAKPMWILFVTGRAHVLFLLKKLLPFLRIKRTKAQDAIRYDILYPRITSGVLLSSLIKEGRANGRARRTL